MNKDIEYFQTLEDFYNSLDEDEFLDREGFMDIIRKKLINHRAKAHNLQTEGRKPLKGSED